MQEAPLLSLIIVSYNTRAVLRDSLASVRAHAGVHMETIVVDNASPDGSADMVAEEFPEMRLVRNTANVGFSPANNTGMQQARGRYIVLLNPDTVLRPGCLGMWLDAHERVGASISGTRLVGRDGALQVSAWRVPGLIDALLELFLLHGIVRRNRYPAQRFSTDFEAGFVSGAAMLFERALFERTGGLDPGMFWMEDTDLCHRVRKAGGTCWFVNGPGIVHIGGESARHNLDRAISNQLISRIKFTRKHSGAAAGWLMAMVVALHAATRAIAFGVIALFREEPRAQAYRHTLRRWFAYVVNNDRSI